MNFKISQEAILDLENIWLYTFENWSLEQADRYFNLIMNEIEQITLNPKLGNDFGTIRKGYYKYRIKSHFIFYKLNQGHEVVEIIRILHQRMDIESHLDL
jgi:toxin ParE1/3/4